MRSIKMSSILLFAWVLIFGTARFGKAGSMGTLFTYQGRLMDANSPADGFYDFEFRLYDDPNSTGLQIGPTVVVDDHDVIDGYFTVELEFGNKAFGGDARWLEIGVRPGSNEERYTILGPRQEVTPAPYAIYAENSGTDNDWLVSGNDMYAIPSGRVGIGTVTPNASLEVTNTGDAHAIWASTAAIPIYANRTSTIGTWPAVAGDCNSQANDASGVRGKILSTSPGSLSAGVYGYNCGTSGNGVGVRGYHNGTGAGVYGQCPNGKAIYGVTTGGYAGYFTGGKNYFEGNVGIGTTLPAEKLHVAGNLKVNGTITSGSGNINSPIAYGFISEYASVLKASPNVSCTYNSTLTRYEISISGEPLDYYSHIFSLTYINTGAPRFITGQVVDEKLIVEIWSPTSTKVVGRFHFILYKI